MSELRALLESRLDPIPDGLEWLRRPSDSGDHSLSNDAPASEDAALKPAAVLVPLIDRPDGLTVLLTERSYALPSHAGQVSFPGGRIDDSDIDAAAAAKREAHEEVGIDPSLVEVIGSYETYETGTQFCILPVVGFVDLRFEVTVNPAEVQEVFEVPFEFLMNPENHARHSAVWRGKRREYYAMPYDGHYIWGATAGMLVNLHKRLFAR